MPNALPPCGGSCNHALPTVAQPALSPIAKKATNAEYSVAVMNVAGGRR